MRIVTRPDFDGIVCAVLLKDALDINGPIRWVEPGDLQKGRVKIEPDEIVANLPYHPGCGLWFDHHYSNLPSESFEGAFDIAPSAAGVIHRHYHNNLTGNYTELVSAADKIDSADLSLDEVLKPENDPYILLSMTINGQDPTGPLYWNTLVDLLGKGPIEKVLSDPAVKNRCQQVISENHRFRDILIESTTVNRRVAVTEVPEGLVLPCGGAEVALDEHACEGVPAGHRPHALIGVIVVVLTGRAWEPERGQTNEDHEGRDRLRVSEGSSRPVTLARVCRRRGKATSGGSQEQRQQDASHTPVKGRLDRFGVDHHGRPAARAPPRKEAH